MKKIFAVLANFMMLFSMNLLADGLYNKEIWDGSFAYNYVRLQEVNDGFELSLTGSYLELELRNTYIKPWSYPRPTIYIKFKKDDCVKNTENDSVTCASIVPVSSQPLRIFIEQSLYDIDGDVEVITQEPAQEIRLSFDPQKAMKLDIIGARYSWEADDIQTIDFNFAYVYEHSGLEFPQRLRTYLNSAE